MDSKNGLQPANLVKKVWDDETYEFDLEVEDDRGLTENVTLWLAADLRFVGRNDEAENGRILDQLNSCLASDMTAPPVRSFRIAGIDPLHVSECSDGPGSKFWRFQYKTDSARRLEELGIFWKQYE